MSTVINTNVTAIVARRNLAQTGVAFGKSVEKIGSGLRINRAADDAAGLAISEKLRSQVKGYNMAVRNVQDGVSLVQTAEGALNEVHGMLQRMRELAVQAANGTMAQEDRDAVGQEAKALADEIDRIATTTKFNGISLLDSTSTVDILAGVDGTETISVAFVDVQISAIDSASAITNFADDTAGNVTGAFATAAIAQLDAAIAEVSAGRSSFGATQNRFEHATVALGIAAENLAASESRIRDLDVAAEMVTMTKNQILQQAGVAVLAQANQASASVLGLLG
jgi:flagellin